MPLLLISILLLEKNSKNVTFVIEKDGEEIFTREYPVNYLLEAKNIPEVTAV